MSAFCCFRRTRTGARRPYEPRSNAVPEIAVGVVIGDSLGRAWRLGTTGTALGAAGVSALVDLRGTPDMFGRPLTVSEVGLADQIASAAALAMGEAGERRPIVLVRGLAADSDESRAADLIRPREFDLFR